MEAKDMSRNIDIENIIRRQQEYERIKQMSLSELLNIQKDNRITDGFLSAEVVGEIKNVYWKDRNRKTWRRSVFIFFMICAVCLFSGVFIILVSTAILLPKEISAGDEKLQKAYENSPRQQAERAIEDGDYDKARQLLDNALSENPNGYFLYITYADLYMAQDRNDDAVEVLADAVYHHFYVQNVFTENNYFYQKLKEISPDSLETSLQTYQSCLADCEDYIKKYEKMDSLIAQEAYDSALSICEELKSEGAYDNYLCDYYCKCYIGMKDYDRCAEYLIGLYGKQQGVTDWRYPSDEEIRFRLNEIKEDVSPGVAEQIEGLQE